MIFPVVPGRGVEVVVVVVETGVFEVRACSSVSIPKVAQVSSPNDFTSRIMASTLRRSFGLGDR